MVHNLRLLNGIVAISNQANTWLKYTRETAILIYVASVESRFEWSVWGIAQWPHTGNVIILPLIKKKLP